MVTRIGGRVFGAWMNCPFKMGTLLKNHDTSIMQGYGSLFHSKRHIIVGFKKLYRNTDFFLLQYSSLSRVIIITGCHCSVLFWPSYLIAVVTIVTFFFTVNRDAVPTIAVQIILCVQFTSLQNVSWRNLFEEPAFPFVYSAPRFIDLIIIPTHHHQYSGVQLEVWCNQQREQKQNDKQFNLTSNHACAEW